MCSPTKDHNLPVNSNLKGISKLTAWFDEKEYVQLVDMPELKEHYINWDQRKRIRNYVTDSAPKTEAMTVLFRKWRKRQFIYITYS